MPDKRGLLLGIDGGGTKTLALLADQEGRVLGRGEAGPGNYHAAGAEAARAALDGAVQQAIRAAGLAGQVVLAGVCLGMAGVDRPADTALVGGWARAFAGGAPVEVVNDARLVLEAVDASHSPHGDGRVHLAGSAPPWGLAVIGGTGSIVYGWDAQGRSARAGGWGYLLGDEGSGYAVGLAGLRAVTKAHDGTGSPTLLAERILSALGLDAPPDLIRWMYRAPLPRAEVAALSRVVEASAAEGDPLAAAILEEAGRDLAAAAVAVAARLGLNGPIPCGMAGGALVRGPGLGAAFLRGAQGLGLRLAPAVRVEEPVLGALRIAARQKQP